MHCCKQAIWKALLVLTINCFKIKLKTFSYFLKTYETKNYVKMYKIQNIRGQEYWCKYVKVFIYNLKMLYFYYRGCKMFTEKLTLVVLIGSFLL